MSKAQRKAYEVLTHAILHCLYGSETIDRDADRADRDAAEIMRIARMEVSDNEC